MNVLEIVHICERTGVSFTVHHGAALRSDDGTVVIDLLDDGDMAVIGVGTLLACGEHDDVTDMARGIVDPIAQGLRGSGPLASIAEPAGRPS